MSAKLSQAQQDIIWKMQHGRQLIRHKQWCGSPSYFSLERSDSSNEFADKRTINSLIGRGLVEVAEIERRWSAYRLTDAGRKVVA